MRRCLPLLWIACLGLAHTAGAQVPAAQTLNLDSTRSHAAFEVKVLFLIGLHGEFSSVHGALSVDRPGGAARVDALIDTSTVRMHSHRYENWTKSAEFFDAQHFPQIHFVSDPFPLSRFAEGGEIDGVLTIRGATQRVTFELAPAACASPLAGTCAVEATGTIRRSDFGMRSRRGTLSDKIDLSFAIFVRPP
jgi:polyisoprenoid-binding protein YceI